MLKKTILILTFFFAGIWTLHWDVQRRYFDFSQVPAEKTKLRVLVLHRNGIGEQESCARIKTACRNLGWDCFSCSSRLSTWQRTLLSRPLEKAIDAVRPDFTINLQSAEIHAPGINFASLSSGLTHYAKEGFDWKKYASFDGFLPTFQNTQFLKEKIESLGKPYRGMRWFFSCPKTRFAPLPKTPRLFYCGTNWDKTRKGGKYKQLFRKLDQAGLISIYGPKNAWKHTPASYRGFLPLDGQSTLKAMHECGAVLILHSDAHLTGNAPTGRIFEAAAASCVIISDRHPFIVQEFGDSVLYVNQEASAKGLFQEISLHLDWIRSHPQEAQEMAKRSHVIFERRFTLESQLKQLKAIYDEIQQSS